MHAGSEIDLNAPSPEDPILFYFGCWNGAGHYLRGPSENMGVAVGPFTLGMLDGGFAYHVRDRSGMFVQDENAVSVTHYKGWTVMAMWDRSVDTRGGSNAAFICDGLRSHEEMWKLARKYYPRIVARLKAAPFIDVEEKT